MTRDNKTPGKEKYLRSIYELLNRGCNKKAAQDIDKLPKKIKDLTVFKALKSLALIRMYKRRQAFDVLNEINPEDDLDEVTLQTMTSCYKESVDVGRIVDLYEAAARRKPDDVDIMTHLFMAHVRIFNFKRQKEIALQIYRICHKKRRLYSFWAIMSLVMQSQENRSGCSNELATDQKVCLTLAEKMCEKMIDDERTHEEIELYLMILRKQGKHEEEYRFLTGPICARITDHLSWFNRRRAYLCLDLKMYSRAFKHYFPSLIMEYPDQIEYYEGLFKSAFLLDTEAPSQQQPVALNDSQATVPTSVQQTGTPVKSTSALAECYDIVEKQCSLTQENAEPTKEGSGQKSRNQASSKNLSRTSSNNPSNRRRLLRGPFIAKIQLYHTILTNENTLPQNIFNQCKNQFIDKYATLNSLLLDYFQTFSRKIICFYDMDYMINEFKLSDEDKSQLVKSVGDWISSNLSAQQSSQQDSSNASDAFYTLLNYHMLKHLLHSYKSTDTREQRLGITKEFIDLYIKNKDLGKNSSKAEFQPVDNYCLLAINALMTNANTLDNFKGQTILSDSIIISLITMAEVAIANSPSNHQLKLTLLKLYSFIGASKQCSAVLLTLDIKHFQIDTLGHLLNPVLYNTGHYNLSKESLETCLEFYAHGVRECFEGLTTSYRDARFSKIEEISGVLRKLCDSLNATQCVLLKGLVSNLSAENFDELQAACQAFDPFKGLHRMFRCPDCVDTIRDNRDFKVLKSFNAETNQLIQKRQLGTLEDEQLWLKMRYYLLRSVYLQLEYLSDQCTPLEGNKSDHVIELKLGKEEVDKLMPKLVEAARSSTDKRYSYFEPESSSFRWTHSNFQSLISLVTPLIFITNPADIDTKVQEEYSSQLDAIFSELETQLSSIQSFVEMKQSLLSLTNALEFISLGITSLVSLSHHNSSSGGQSKKQFSSSSSSQQQQQTPVCKPKVITQQMISKTEAKLNKLSSSIKNIDPKTLILDKINGPEKELSLGSEDQQTFDRIKEKLIDSFNESLKEIETTCRRKIKLLRPKESGSNNRDKVA